jgi:hypothetical protein
MTATRPVLSRRPVLIGLGATVIAAVAGIALDIPNLLRRRATGPHADLVNRLDDPEGAAVLGRAVMKSTHDAPIDRWAAIARGNIGQQDLGRALAADIAQDRLIEAEGWLVPATLAAISVVATRSL